MDRRAGPLLKDGDIVSRGRALKNLEFFFSDGGQSEFGIFYAASDGINWGGDNYFVTDHIGSNSWIHVRRCGDYLYFVIKHFKLLEERGEKDRIKTEWLNKTKKCADALCKVWEDNNHFGQYINPNTLKIQIGNSDAGGIIPAALAVFINNKAVVGLEIKNNTNYDCDTGVFIENESQMKRILEFNAIGNSIILKIPANKTIQFII